MRRRRQRLPGLTRLEVVAVVAVTLVVAGVVLPVAEDELRAARRMRAENDAATIAAALQRYREDTGAWPRTAFRVDAEGVPVSELTELFASGAKGPYLPRERSERLATEAATSDAPAAPAAAGGARLDPWGHPYRVLLPSDVGAAVAAVVSTGPNGRLESTLVDALAGRHGGDDIVDLVRGR